jgi:hypothetical protein
MASMPSSQPADAQQQPQQENAQQTPSGKAGEEEPSSHAPSAQPQQNAAFVNGALAVPGAPANTDTVPAKYSQKNAADDELITTAYTFKTLSDDERRAIYQDPRKGLAKCSRPTKHAACGNLPTAQSVGNGMIWSAAARPSMSSLSLATWSRSGSAERVGCA